MVLAVPNNPPADGVEVPNKPPVDVVVVPKPASEFNVFRPVTCFRDICKQHRPSSDTATSEL